MSSEKYKISTWLAEFVDRDVEMDFQNHMQPTTTRQMKVVLIVWAGLLSLFAVPDFIVLGLIQPFYYLLIFRILSLIAISVLFFMIRPETNIFKISYPVALLIMVYTTGFMLFFFYRSDSENLVIAVVALQIMALLMYVPIRFVLSFSAALYSVAITLTTLFATGSTGLMLIAVFVFFMLPVVVGAVSAIRLGIWQRKQYVLLRETEKINKDLRQALSDKKELIGLLPICASCKKIRDDKGYWNQIESYIQHHSNAEFSHGMCPECSEKLYGDEEWYIKMKKKNKAE